MRTAGLWLLRIVVALALLIVAGFAALGLVVRGQLSRKFTVADVALNIPSDSAAIARGQHLNVIFNCRGCHGADLEGTVMFEAPPVGRLCAPNLTRTGVTRSFTPSDWNRAVRHGVKPDGTGLMIMPAELFHGLSDADLGAIVAYAQSLPPVDKVVPPSRLRPVGWLMAMMLPDGLTAASQMDHEAAVPQAPEIGVTAEYGGYLANACKGCHGAALSGGKSGEPGAPPAPNLTPAPDGHLRSWTQAQFIAAIRTGMTPEGKFLSGYMPWASFGLMTDDELTALWLFLHGLPPRASTAPQAK